MKKLFFLVTILMMFLLSGCSDIERAATEKSEKEKSFPALPEEISEIKDIYQEEIVSRTNSTVNFFADDTIEAFDMIALTNSLDFFSEQEITAFEKYGYTIISKKGLAELDGVIYYYPVIFQDTEELVILYNHQGKFQKRNLNPEHANRIYEPLDYEFIHFTESSYAVCEEIEVNEEYALIYDQTSGKVQKWRFGQLANSYNLSKGTTYEGKSELEGYIFQSGTNAYALTYDGTLNQIATNIDKVISCNYRVSADYYSQPVFLMQNGRKNALIENTLTKI